ncbi:hypothetical protein [Methanobrevibacter sp.]|uniref:hypothetical protein n=1 Tax=Methanobrevibacter sp. TaxID=66852 RepID=UPI00388F5A8A
MNITKKLLTLLAIFCVIASAGAVCAADADMDGTYLSATDDMGVGDHPDFDDIDDATYDGGWAGGQYNGNMEDGHSGAPEIDPDYAHDEAAGEPTNTTGNATDNATANTTAQAVQNQTANATAAHHMLATGNPILLLLGVTTVLGAGAVLRKR